MHTDKDARAVHFLIIAMPLLRLGIMMANIPLSNQFKNGHGAPYVTFFSELRDVRPCTEVFSKLGSAESALGGNIFPAIMMIK